MKRIFALSLAILALSTAAALAKGEDGAAPADPEATLTDESAGAPPSDHAGQALADLLLANGCSLTMEEAVGSLADADMSVSEFQQQVAALIAESYLDSDGQGTLALVNWGECE